MPAQILEEDEIRQLRSQYMSDNTTYMKWVTEIEPKKDMMDSAFIQRNKLLLMFADKFAPLANFNDPQMMALHKLKMLNMELALEAGLTDIAEETVISAIDDIQLSRGDHGFFQKALITQRHELTEQRTEGEKKVGFFNKLLGRNKSPEEQEQGPR
jgi:hypothetical protein